MPILSCYHLTNINKHHEGVFQCLHVRITTIVPYSHQATISRTLRCLVTHTGASDIFSLVTSRVRIMANMMTSSNGNIFRVTGHLCGEFTGPGEFPAQSPVTRSFGVFFGLRLHKQLSKQSGGRWFETQSRPLWRHCNEIASRVKTVFTINHTLFHM